MSTLFYVDGVVTDPKLRGPVVVAHVCNETGIWSGVQSHTISTKWPVVRSMYYRWYRNRIKNDFSMGNVQFVTIPTKGHSKRIRVATMIAQTNSRQPIRYSGLEKCLAIVSQKARKIGASVHVSKFAEDQTDSWPDLLQIIERRLCNDQITVYVYQIKNERTNYK